MTCKEAIARLILLGFTPSNFYNNSFSRKNEQVVIGVANKGYIFYSANALLSTKGKHFYSYDSFFEFLLNDQK